MAVYAAQKAGPLIQCGGAVGLEVIALGEASVLIEMVMNGSVDSDEFLQGSHAPEADHCPFSSSRWLMCILGPIVEPAASFLFVSAADDLHRRTVRSQLVDHEDLRFAMPFHRFSKEFQCCFAISALCNEAFENFPFVIDRAPKVVLLPIYFHEHFI